MNQILVTEKLYITPELKRKKKMYKFNFLFSVFLVCILISLCIYAEYDRNKSEEASQAILANMNNDDTTVANNNILVVVLDDSEQNEKRYEKHRKEAASGDNLRKEHGQNRQGHQ